MRAGSLPSVRFHLGEVQVKVTTEVKGMVTGRWLCLGEDLRQGATCQLCHCPTARWPCGHTEAWLCVCCWGQCCRVGGWRPGRGMEGVEGASRGSVREWLHLLKAWPTGLLKMAFRGVCSPQADLLMCFEVSSLSYFHTYYCM